MRFPGLFESPAMLLNQPVFALSKHIRPLVRWIYKLRQDEFVRAVDEQYLYQQVYILQILLESRLLVFPLLAPGFHSLLAWVLKYPGWQHLQLPGP